MKNWRTIKKAIENALSQFSVTVQYIPPTGKGNNAQCSEFLVTVLDDSKDFFEEILCALQPVCKMYNLSMYPEFPFIHLCAHWDIKAD